MSSPNQSDAPSIKTTEVFAAVQSLRRATAWSGTYLTTPDVTIGHGNADAAIDRVTFLLRNLPRRYSEQFATAADAALQGMVDAMSADESSTRSNTSED